MSRASIGDYVVTSKLGSGSFAVVYKGYHRVTHVPVAIKAMSLSKLNTKLLANLETEIAIMRQIDHPNVVKLYEIKKTEKHIYLVLEYCAGGDLQQFMRRQDQRASGNASPTVSPVTGVQVPPKREKLSEQVAHHFLRELAQGMLCLWSHNLIHRDLKPQNLLLVDDSPTSALKIADFGFARHLATASLAETLCGSPLYMAPEILKFQKYDAKADLWSVGTILFEMVTGKPPYGGSNHVQLLANIERTDLRFPQGIDLSDACRSLLVGLLQRKPVARIGFDEFFAHPFVGLRAQSALALSSSVPATSLATSIREEDDGGTDAVHTNDPTPSPTNATLRQSRSGNLEVMQTAFGSTSSGGGSSAAATLRRSTTTTTRLGRSRRAASSNAVLASQANATSISPKLSPQMSPHMLPSPSPRINPFKQTAATQLQRTTGRSATPTGSLTGGSGRAVKSSTGSTSNVALDSSDEYVLVESGSEKSATTQPSARVAAAATAVDKQRTVGPSTSTSTQATGSTSIVRAGSASPSSAIGPSQFVDIVLLRAQAIAPIAETLWRLSASSSAAEPSPSQSPTQSQSQSQRESSGGNAIGNGNGLASLFSITSSLSSTSADGIGNVPAAAGYSSHLLDTDDTDASAAVERRQVACAAEALALYVKCLRLVQRGIAFVQQQASDELATARQPTNSHVAWTDASRTLSLAFLTEQLTMFLDRAESCRQRLRVASDVTVTVTVTPDELLYTHALRLGQQGAVFEVLGQSQCAYERYLQAMLLLESLSLMDDVAPGTATIDDHKCVNAFLRALDERLQHVKQLIDSTQQNPNPNPNKEPVTTAAGFREPLAAALKSGGVM